MRNLINRKNRGFTLIELLVVIAIIGILAAVVLVSLNSARAKSRDARRLADVRQVMTALELFYNDNSRYPTATANAPTAGDGAAGSTFATFMSKYPAAPLPADGTCTTDAPSTNGTAYVYAQTGAGTGYTIKFCIGGPTGGFVAGGGTASQSGISQP